MKTLLFSIGIISIVLMNACSPYRVIEKHPERFQYLFPCDTATRIEEKVVKIHIPGDSVVYDRYILHDTVIHDTVIRNNTKLVIRYEKGMLHAEADCKDTVFVYKYIDTVKTKSIERRKKTIPALKDVPIRERIFSLIAIVLTMFILFMYFKKTK